MRFPKLLIIALLCCSCGEYQSVMKTNDTGLMYEKGVDFYNRGEYKKCLNLMDRVRLYSTYSLGSKRSQSVAYYRAYSTYGKKSYVEAAELFRQFVLSYPDSPYYEECLYMIGYCYYMDSPRVRLDQSSTTSSLEFFQVYLDRFPMSSRRSQINVYVEEMLDKISYKAYLNASNYFLREHYKSAIVSLTNCLEDYPSSKYREEIMNMLFNSKYYLAINSVDDKKLERYYAAEEEYYYFEEEFPESRFLPDMRKKMEDVDDFLRSYRYAD